MIEDNRPKYSVKLIQITWILLLLCILSVFFGLIFHNVMWIITLAIIFGVIHIFGVLIIIFLGVSAQRIRWWRLLAVPVFILALPGFFVISYTPIYNISLQIMGKSSPNSVLIILIYFTVSVFMWWWVPGKAMNKWMMMGIGEIPGDFEIKEKKL